jgi:hypothetical protein
MFLILSVGECGSADEAWRLRLGEDYRDDPAECKVLDYHHRCCRIN